MGGDDTPSAGDPALKDMDELAVTQQIVVFRGRPLRSGAFLGTAVQGFEDEGCGRPAAFFAECAVLRVGGRSGGGTGVEGADGGGEGRELDHWAEASRGHRRWSSSGMMAVVSVKSTRRDCSD